MKKVYQIRYIVKGEAMIMHTGFVNEDHLDSYMENPNYEILNVTEL